MANSDDRYEMLRHRELSKLSWVVKEKFIGQGRVTTQRSGFPQRGFHLTIHFALKK